jgi:hypothetical protein
MNTHSRLFTLCIASGFVITSTFTMETPEQPLFSIERYEDTRSGSIEYVHDFTDIKKRQETRLSPIKHPWYYGATYDPTTKTYCSFDDGVTLGSHIVRRPFHASQGPEGSHAAQCYATLKMRYEKQEVAKATAEQKEVPAVSVQMLAYLQNWIHFISK